MSQVNLPDRTVRRAFKALCLGVNTPFSLNAAEMLANEDWLGLASLDVAIQGYHCPVSLSGDLQVAAFFKKYPGFDLGMDLEAQSRETFRLTETQCFNTNVRLDPLLGDLGHYGGDVHDYISRARKEVSRILGRCPEPDELVGKFGPGSTYNDRGPLATVPDKMSSSYTMTARASRFLPAWETTAWHKYACAGNLSISSFGDEVLGPPSWVDGYAVRSGELVRGNRFTSVPKDAKKNRGICIEPSINLFYQLGVGTWLTSRLGKTTGWRKTDIQEYHKFLARLSSLTGLSATIDLSNASDTICTALVELLLPADWFKLLDDLRSHFTFIGGSWTKLEKFSSMGNGFTFELETILFRAIAVAACTSEYTDEWYGSVISVFGDDMIVPTSAAADVIAALAFFGMTTNKNKTFVSGSFRESCGGDYWRGMDMRPHYQKEPLNEPHQFIALANGLRRFGIRHVLCGGSDLYRKPWLCVLDGIPTRIRACKGPTQLGDLVIHDDESRWIWTVRSSIRYIRVWRPVEYGRTGWDHFRPGVVLASALYGVPDGTPSSISANSRLAIGGILTRVSGSYVSGYRFGRVAFS